MLSQKQNRQGFAPLYQDTSVHYKALTKAIYRKKKKTKNENFQKHDPCVNCDKYLWFKKSKFDHKSRIFNMTNYSSVRKHKLRKKIL